MIDFTSTCRRPAGPGHLSGPDVILLSQLCYCSCTQPALGEVVSPSCQAAPTLVPSLPMRSKRSGTGNIANCSWNCLVRMASPLKILQHC